MNTVNPRIRRWLETGHAVDVLIGRPGFFVRDLDYVEEHDRVLATSQLLTWAADTNSVDAAARAVERASEELATEGDLIGAFHVLWTYLVITEDRQMALPLRPGRVAAVIRLLRADRSDSVPRDLVDELDRKLIADPAHLTDEADPAQSGLGG